jgi:predicted  nucleic acid-binding Zn ribbon protein
LTSSLIGEIESLFPSCTEINNDNDNKRDACAFQHKIAQLFPSGRIFASFKQLDQAADIFLGAWAVKKTTHSKSIQCAYSATHDKTESMLMYPKDESLNQH